MSLNVRKNQEEMSNQQVDQIIAFILFNFYFIAEKAETPKKMKAVSPYKGPPGKVSLSKGDEVEVVAPDDDGWTVVRNSKGKEGRVPTDQLGEGCRNIITNVILN